MWTTGRKATSLLFGVVEPDTSILYVAEGAGLLPSPQQIFHHITGVYIFQKVLISSLPILPQRYISFPFHAHLFIVPSLISSPILILAELLPYPKSREFARIHTPAISAS